MPSDYSIVPAQESQAPDIARLSLELGYAMTVEQTRETLRQLLGAPRYLALVATAANGQLLGWVVAERRLSLESGESVELTGLVVAASARRMGVGSALVAAAEKWASQEGFASIRVRSNIARQASHAFYERLGFRRSKTQHVYKKTLPILENPS